MIRILKSFIFLIAFTLFPLSAFASGVHGVFNVVKGDVKVKSGKSGLVKKVKIGSKIFPKDTVITAKDSRAKIVMVDKNVLNISPDSQIVIQNYEFEPKKKKKNVLLNVIYGKVRSKVEQKYDGKNSKFQVKTPSAVAGVRGTDFLASFQQQTKSSDIITFEGKVEFGLPGPNGSIKNPVSVGVGQTAQSISGNLPTPPKALPATQLAALDYESNAESSAPAKSDERQPASKDNSEKKKEPKKSEPESGEKKEPTAENSDDKKADSSEPGSNKDSAKNEPKKSNPDASGKKGEASNSPTKSGPKGSQKGPSGTAAVPGAGGGSGSSSSSGGDGSEPSQNQGGPVGSAPISEGTPDASGSAGTPRAPASSAGPMLIADDLPTGEFQPPPIFEAPVIPQVPIQPINFDGISDSVTDAIQNGTTRVLIRINN